MIELAPRLAKTALDCLLVPDLLHLNLNTQHVQVHAVYYALVKGLQIWLNIFTTNLDLWHLLLSTGCLAIILSTLISLSSSIITFQSYETDVLCWPSFNKYVF